MPDWTNQKVLITGGLGFTGSNLARRLVDYDADVTLLDIVRSEDKLATIEDISNEVEIVDADVRNEEAIERHVPDADVVYHLASKTSRPAANENPRENLDVNCRGPLNVLEAAAGSNDPPRVVYVSTQALLGNVDGTIDESVEPDPIDIYGIHKRTVEDYCDLYTRIKDVPTTVLRPANLYGPGAPLYATGYGIVNQFIGDALRDDELTVFEPSDLREFLFMTDMVDALIRVGEDDRAIDETYVLGTGDPRSMKEAAELVVETAGSGSVELVPWTDTWQEIRRGDVVTDPSKIEEQLGWSAEVDFEEGLKRAIEFYRENPNILEANS
ncbi:NAD(P)-dependent oxidoreductase [Halorubrum sp. Eb13]|uniref:NAD-dependent epimerase/dehydratase family protein n=1 Tax=Halorubrum sp. Eb13 TaxID=1383843 RepID=UPI000B985AFC|nr:NAD-dependent epimerase/dehydratase family protein [Halorubrum sp. Eb13]OYR41420.1 hypothetical protein DJ75_14010 [Halorubrum sp. Eb13]